MLSITLHDDARTTISLRLHYPTLEPKDREHREQGQENAVRPAAQKIITDHVSAWIEKFPQPNTSVVDVLIIGDPNAAALFGVIPGMGPKDPDAEKAIAYALKEMDKVHGIADLIENELGVPGGIEELMNALFATDGRIPSPRRRPADPLEALLGRGKPVSTPFDSMLEAFMGGSPSMKQAPKLSEEDKRWLRAELQEVIGRINAQTESNFWRIMHMHADANDDLLEAFRLMNQHMIDEMPANKLARAALNVWKVIFYGSITAGVIFLGWLFWEWTWRILLGLILAYWALMALSVLIRLAYPYLFIMVACIREPSEHSRYKTFPHTVVCPVCAGSHIRFAWDAVANWWDTSVKAVKSWSIWKAFRKSTDVVDGITLEADEADAPAATAEAGQPTESAESESDGNTVAEIQ